MSKFFEITFSYNEPTTTVATVEAESAEDAVSKVRGYFSHVEDLEIQEVIPLDTSPEGVAQPPKGKPTLRIVN